LLAAGAGLSRRHRPGGSGSDRHRLRRPLHGRSHDGRPPGVRGRAPAGRSAVPVGAATGWHGLERGPGRDANGRCPARRAPPHAGQQPRRRRPSTSWCSSWGSSETVVGGLPRARPRSSWS